MKLIKKGCQKKSESKNESGHTTCDEEKKNDCLKKCEDEAKRIKKAIEDLLKDESDGTGNNCTTLSCKLEELFSGSEFFDGEATRLIKKENGRPGGHVVLGVGLSQGTFGDQGSFDVTDQKGDRSSYRSWPVIIDPVYYNVVQIQDKNWRPYVLDPKNLVDRDEGARNGIEYYPGGLHIPCRSSTSKPKGGD